MQSFLKKEKCKQNFPSVPTPDTNARLTIEFRNISPTRRSVLIVRRTSSRLARHVNVLMMSLTQG